MSDLIDSSSHIVEPKIQDLIRIKDQISELTQVIQKHITDKYEPVDDLRKLNFILEAQFEEVWQMLLTPTEIITPNADLAKPNLKDEFYDVVLGKISHLMLEELSIHKPAYMNEIINFFRVIIVKFFARDTLCEKLSDIVGGIFEWERNLHQKVLSQQSQQEVMFHDNQKSINYRRIQKEQEWRKEVKAGDFVDVVKMVRIKDQTLKSWSRGIVVFRGFQEDQESKTMDIDDHISPQTEKLDIKYEKDSQATIRRFDVQDWQIAPVGTFTNDFDWRYDLKKGDTIDCMDNEKEWYKSTILETRVGQNPEGEVIPEVFVAFRTYDENGSKSEEDGRKFFGWSDKYDEWYFVTDPQIQKFGNCCLQYQRVESANKVYQRPFDKERDMNDKDDLIYNNSDIYQYATPRETYFGRLASIPDALTEFGQQGGFRKILEMLEETAQGRFMLTIQHIQSITTFLSRSLPLWTRHFAIKFTVPFTEVLLRALIYINKDKTDKNKNTLIIGVLQNDNFKANYLEYLINTLIDPIWKRHYTMEMIVGKIQCDYMLQIGSSLMMLSNLQKRIQGIKYINEAIKQVRQPYQMYKYMNTQDVIVELRRMGIINLIFGDNTHYQIIHRSQDFIRLFFNEKEIKEEEIDMIWNLCNREGQQIKLEIYKIILEVLRQSHSAMTDQTKDYFIDKLAQVTPSQMIEKDIEIITELGKKIGVAFRQPEPYVTKAAQILWQVATLEKDYPKNIAVIARKKFCDQVQSWDDSFKEQYVALCLDNISNNKMSLQNLKIAVKLIQKMNYSSYQGRRTRADFSKDLLDTQDFANMVITDLDNYIEFSNSLVQKGVLDLETLKTLDLSEYDNQLYTHFKNLKTRIKRLKTVIHIAKEKITCEQIEKIWDIMVTKSLLRENDQNIFFNWFKMLLGKEFKHIISDDLMIDLFRKKIIPSDLGLLKTLKVNGLECIVRLFVLVNEIEGNVLDLDPQKKQSVENSWQQQYAGYQSGSGYNYQYANYNNTGNNNANNEEVNSIKPKFNRFRVNIMPSELEGIKILWGLLGAHDQSNQSLFLMVQRTLINIYSNLSVELEDRKTIIYDQFIEECIKCLQNINQDTKREQKHKRESNRFISQMIVTFFEQAEENGIGKMKLHRQLEDGKYVKKLVFETKLPFKRGVQPNYIEIRTYSSMSIWELKTLIAKYTDQSPLNISIKRADTKKAEIKDSKNSKLLCDLNFCDDEIFSIARAKIVDPTPVPLVDKEGNLSPELETIVKEWFHTFSKDVTKQEIIEISNENGFSKDPINPDDLPETVRAMTRRICVDFAEAITTAQEISIGDPRVNHLFDTYSKTIGNGNLLVEHELLQFYKEQARTKEEVVIQNLKHQNIGVDLKPRIDFHNLNFINDLRVLKDETTLPRARVSSNQDLFNKIFDLVETSEGEEAEPIWQLLTCLQTNKQMEEKILSNKQIEELFHINEEQPNLYRILYSLQIVQSLIYEYKQKKPCELVQYIQSTIQESPVNQKLEAENYEQDFPAMDKADSVGSNIANSGLEPEQDLYSAGYSGNTNQMIDSTVAIPMPYAGPLLPGQKYMDDTYDVPMSGNEIQTQTDGIPMAPRSAAHSIGPPNQHNTHQEIQSIDQFEGNRIVVSINENNSHSDARKQWLPNFMLSGGVSKLIDLIQKLSSFTQAESKHSENTKRIAKKCLGEVMLCVRILLSSQFCANSKDQDLVMTLQRKLSTCSRTEPKQEESIVYKSPESTDTTRKSAVPGQQNQQKEKKNKLLEEQENTLEEMQPLIELLKSRIDLDINDNLSQGLEAFQDQLLAVIIDQIERKDSKAEDTDIITQGLSIWLSCLASNPQFLNKIYDEFQNPQITEKPTFSSTIIEKGLVCSENKVRDPFANTIRFIVQSIKSSSLKMTPLYFFLKLMILKLDYVQNKSFSRYTKNFFTVLKELLPMYLDRQKYPGAINQEETLDIQGLCQNVIVRLFNYESNEKKNSYLDDYTLIGFIDIIKILIESNPTILKASEMEELAQMILQKCLFSLEFNPVETHITSAVDLEPIEKKQINKCHAKESIQAAYNLLITICKCQKESNLTQKILENYWLRQIFSVDKPQKAGFSPQSDGRSWNGYCGIKNLGAVCYMNSMMQQFYNVPTFRYCLLAANDDQDMNIQNYNGLDIDDNLLHQMMNMFGFLQLSDRQYYNPTPFCFSFKSFDGEPTNVREQKDAQEFLNVGFDKIEHLLKNTSQKYLLQNTFGGQTCSIMRCQNCGNTRQNKEDFYNLSLEVKNQHNVLDGLKKLVTGEIISDYKCEACNQKTDLEKKMTIDKLPNTLIIHLQRITFDFEVMKNVKYNDRLEFPNVLDLKEFSTEEILKKDKKNMKKKNSVKTNVKVEDAKFDGLEQLEPEQVEEAQIEEQSDQDEDEDSEEKNNKDYEFKLVGVVCHMGVAEAGHYLSYINVERDSETQKIPRDEWINIEKQTWLEFNDQNVSRFNFSQLEKNCYGGAQNSQSAYMLIYEKRIKEKIKLVIPQNVMQALACDGTAMTSQEDLHLFQVFPNLKQQIIENRDLVKNEKDECVALVDFNEAKKFVPNKIYRMVHQDNKKFLCEKQVYSDSFYKCTLELLELSIQSHPITQDITEDATKFELIFKIIDRVVFDLLVNSASHQALKGMTDLLIVILSKSDAAVVYLMKSRIFAAPETLGKDEKNFFETVCSHMETDVRQMAGTILGFVLERLYQIGGEENLNLIEQAITKLLDQMPNEAQKHFMRLHDYFTLILDLAKSNALFFNILIKNNTVTRLIDLMCKFNPMYVTSKPPLEKLVATISFIIRSYPCIIDINDATNFSNNSEIIDKETLIQLQMETRGSSPFFKPQSFGEVLQLSNEDNKSVFNHSKQFKVFYENVSKHGYEMEEFAKCTAHLCYKNREYSKKLAKHILKGVNNTQADEIAPFLELMKQYLSVQDEYFELRLEWIFGVADLVVRTTSYQLYNQQPKLGVAFAETINSQVFRYFSPLFKTASSLYGRKECALQALISNKKQQSKAVLFSLKCILEAIIADESRRILNYLKKMDPPTYQFARYWDWIKPWVENEVETNTKYQNVVAYRQELEPSINVLSLIEQVELLEPTGHQKGDIIEYPEQDGGGKPYILWDIVESLEYGKQQDQKGMVEVIVNQITCNISQSLPNGEENLALLDVFNTTSNNNNNNYYQQYDPDHDVQPNKKQRILRLQGGNGAQGASGSGGRAAHQIRRNFGRGQNGRKNNIINRYQKKNEQKKKVKAADMDADSEDASPDEEQIQQRNVRFLVDNDLEPQGDYSQDYYKQMQQNDIENQKEPEQEYEMQGANNQDQSLQQFPSQCILTFKVENKTNLGQTIELTILPVGPCNFKCPVAVIPCEVYSNSNTAIIHLTKLDPEQDWGQFEWSFRLLENNMVGQYGSYPPAVAAADYAMPYDGATIDEYNMGATGDAGGTKDCGTCTYTNPGTNTHCEMCESVLN